MLYLWTYCEDVGNRSIFYKLLHPYIGRNAWTDKYLKIYAHGVPKPTSVSIYNVGYYYYYYYYYYCYYPTVTISCNMFTDTITKFKKYQVLRSCYLSIVRQTHKYTWWNWDILFESYHTDSATSYCSSCKLSECRLIVPCGLVFPETAQVFASYLDPEQRYYIPVTGHPVLRHTRIGWIILEYWIFWCSF